MAKRVAAAREIDAQLVIDGCQVRVDCTRTDDELFGHLLICQSLGHDPFIQQGTWVMVSQLPLLLDLPWRAPDQASCYDPRPKLPQMPPS